MYEYLICVATINGPERLENFLKSVRSNTPSSINYAIAIADDNSIEQFAQRNYQLAVNYNCFYRRNEFRSGVPFTWNRATELADSEWIIIANDDILVVPKWLEAHKAFVAANSDKKIGALSWPLTNTLGGQKNNDLIVGIGPDSYQIDHPVVSCAGCLFAFSRQLFNQVNGFDERYFATYEEVDFGGKLSMLGYKSLGMNDPLVYHQNGASFSDPLNQQDPAFQKHKLAEKQFIDKWCEILSIKKGKKKSDTLVKEISDRLVAMQPYYYDEEYKRVWV